jgi:hypothetical protein
LFSSPSDQRSSWPLRGGRNLLRLSTVITLVTLAACGGDGGGNAPGPAPVSTLAYVVTECRENGRTASAHQTLIIRRGEQEVTVREVAVGPLPALGYCRRMDQRSPVFLLPFQRLGVSPDGSSVVFEVTDDYSVVAPSLPHGLLPPHEEEGIFVVRADGTGLHRLGPASREPCFVFSFGLVTDWPRFSFSPDGQRIAFTDRGLGPTGEESAQVVTMDVHTGERAPVTHLPPLTPFLPAFAPIESTWFVDGETIGFFKNSMPEGEAFYTVKMGQNDEPVRSPPPAAIPGASIVPEPFIGPPGTRVLLVSMQGTAPPYNLPILELFVEHGDDLLQLTNFGSADTLGGRLDRDEQRVLFVALADPLGTNPCGNPEFFSIDTLAGDLRQLTQFGAGAESRCRPCRINIFGAGQEPRAGPDAIVFHSTCDPLGENHSGLQLFAMRFDGSDLRQLTHTRGSSTEPDGTVTAEVPYPWAYPEVW